MADPAPLNARDTTLVFVSRAPQPDIEHWKARMGWEQIPWYTTALGRQEEWEDSPEGYPQTPPYGWARLHDEYGGDSEPTRH